MLKFELNKILLTANFIYVYLFSSCNKHKDDAVSLLGKFSLHEVKSELTEFIG